jgi:hypothetical protein
MDDDHVHELDIANVAKGAAPELFLYELDRVLRNIKDPNTGPGKRKIVMTFTFVPHVDKNDSRSEMATYVEAQARLQPVLPASSFAFISRRGDKITASVHDVEQGELLKSADVLPLPQKGA